MGYWLEDTDGEWLGDFATNVGIMELRGFKMPSLNKFLDDGEAGGVLIEKVVQEVVEKKETKYIAEMLKEVNAPVFITDGCGDEEEEDKSIDEIVEKHGNHDQATHGRGGGASVARDKLRKGLGGETIVNTDYVDENSPAFETISNELDRMNGLSSSPKMKINIDELAVIEGESVGGLYGSEDAAGVYLSFGHGKSVSGDIAISVGREMSGEDEAFTATVGESVEAIFRHEYGHAIYGQNLDAGDKAEWKTLYEEHKWPIENGVSDYGGTNEEEGFAECFSHMTSRNHNAMREELMDDGLGPTVAVLDGFFKEKLGI